MSARTTRSETPERPIRVLIVDDHPMVREGLRAILRTRGITVVGEATCGREAVEAAELLTPEVILMDIQMPDLDGLAATRAILEKLPGVKVLILTSHENRGYLKLALEAGACGYLLKGSSRDVIINGIRLAREGGAPISEAPLRHMLKAAAEEAPEGEGPLASLSPTEKRVLALITEGLTNKEIADRISYSVGTVKNVVQRIIEKLGVADRTQAAVLATREGQGIP